MDRTVALTRLTNMVAASERPVLSLDDLDALLAAWAVPDQDGRLPQDPTWSGTWDLNAAAADGWRWKAGRVAGDFTFSADDASFSKGDVMAKCLQMADEYAAKGMGYIGVRDDRAHAPYDSPRLRVNG
jgi:hypothetical protein